MGEVVKFKKPRNKGIRTLARESHTEAVNTVGSPQAVIIVALGKDGSFAQRVVHSDEVKPFDVYARAEALMTGEKMSFIEGEDD